MLKSIFIVEILSESMENNDHTFKFNLYKSILSLKDIYAKVTFPTT